MSGNTENWSEKPWKCRGKVTAGTQTSTFAYKSVILHLLIMDEEHIEVIDLFQQRFCRKNGKLEDHII